MVSAKIQTARKYQNVVLMVEMDRVKIFRYRIRIGLDPVQIRIGSNSRVLKVIV